MIDYMTRTAKDDSDAAEFAYRLDRMTAERDALRKEVEELRRDKEIFQSESKLYLKSFEQASEQLRQLKSQVTTSAAAAPAPDKFAAIRKQFASVPVSKLRFTANSLPTPSSGFSERLKRCNPS